MPTILPTDSQGTAIPALRPRSGGAHEIALSTSSARNAIAFDTATRVIAVYATSAVRMVLGDATASATAADHYLPAGQYIYLSVGSERHGLASHLAAIAEATGGSLYISELD